MKYLASSNLITDLKFKQQVGVKADAHIEALAIINKNEGENDENVDLKIQLENRDELQINAKLFVKSFDIDLCLEAVKCLKQAFEVEKIDSLTFSVPAEVIFERIFSRYKKRFLRKSGTAIDVNIWVLWVF